MRALKELAKRLLQPQRYAEEQDERRLEQMMGFRGQYRAHRDFQLSLLKARGLAPHHRLLEIGCGPLTPGVPIIEYLEVGGYAGIDVRPLVIDEAHRLISKHRLGAKNPRALRSSSFGRDELDSQTFDVMVSFSVLYHLEDQLVAQLFEQLPRRLAKGGVYYANVNTEHTSSQWLEFPFLQRSLTFYEQLAGGQRMRMEVLGQGKDLGIAESDEACLNHYLAFRMQS